MRDKGTTAGVVAGIILVMAFCSSAFSQSITVGSGAGFNVGDGVVDAGCGDLTVAGAMIFGSGSIASLRNVSLAGGTVNLGSGSLSFSGDWINSGSFTAGAGQVSLVDGCGTTTSAFSGNTSFYSFTAVTGSGRQLQLAAGSTQTFTNSLTLQGSGANPIMIRSNSPGTQAAFVLPDGASQNISGVDVADNNAAGGQTLAPVDPPDVDSIDSGNNSNWFRAMIPGITTEPITTLPLPALLALAGMLALLARRFLQSRNSLQAISV